MLLETIILSVTMTCYRATSKECGKDSLTTASGAKIESTETAYKHRYLAVSRELRDVFKYGTIVTIEGCSIEEYNGEWEVADTMAPSIKNTVDILINPGMKLTKEKVTIKCNGEQSN